MRIKELLEAYDLISNPPGGRASYEENQKVANYLKTHCGPWLEHTNNGNDVVYRGTKIRMDYESVALKTVRNDRTPKDSSGFMHNVYNLLISIAGGKANRSNSIFVTSNSHQASIYGTVFTVFPIGQFHYTWSPYTTDWTVKLGMEEIRNQVMTRSGKDKSEMNDQAFLDPNSYNPNFVKQLIQCDTGLHEAISESKEIMVQCSAAVYMEPSYYTNRIKPILLGKQ